MFYTIENKVFSELKIQRSLFIAALYPVESPEQARSILAEHARQYADATHNCYAYACGINQEITYYADAGEPGGTAGKPILNALLRNNLSNVLAVVTRYYGGIKLGVKGLIEAYGAAVEQAVGNARLVAARLWHVFHVECDYPSFDSLKHRCSDLDHMLSEVSYAQKVSFDLSVADEQKQQLIDILDGYTLFSGLIYSHKT